MRRIEDAHFDAFLALPGVAGQGPGNMHGLPAAGQERVAERAAHGAEGDGTDLAAVPGPQTEPDMRPADEVRTSA